MAYIDAYREEFGVGPICRALRGVEVRISPSGYYAARARPPSARAVRDAALEKEIAAARWRILTVKLARS